MGKYGHFQRSVNLLTPGILSVYLLCRLMTVSCFQKNRFGEIVNSGSQSNSKVQSTLNVDISILYEKEIPLIQI